MSPCASASSSPSKNKIIKYSPSVQLCKEMGIISFFRTNEIFREKRCRSEKKNDGRKKWIVQRNEKLSFFKTSKKMNDLKSFELTWIKRTNIPKDLEKNRFFTERAISLNKLFKKWWFFTEQRFYYTNDFTERSFREKTNDTFLRTNKIDYWKKMNEMGCSRKMNNRKEKNRAWPSLLRTSDATHLLLRSPEQMYLNAVKLSKHDHIWRIRLFKVETTDYLIRQTYW